MKLYINSEVGLGPHTRKEILEDEHPDLWVKAMTLVRRLINLQNEVILLLPPIKEALPSSYAQYLQENDAKEALRYYIQLCSLYAFVKNISERLEEDCRGLVDLVDQRSSYYIERLEETLKADTDYAPFLLNKSEAFLRLCEFNEAFSDRKDFTVFSNWTFRDIYYNLKKHPDIPLSLWDSAINSSAPVRPNIEELLESDNELVRIY